MSAEELSDLRSRAGQDEVDALMQLGALLVEDPSTRMEGIAYWKRAAQLGEKGAFLNIGTLYAKLYTASRRNDANSGPLWNDAFFASALSAYKPLVGLFLDAQQKDTAEHGPTNETLLQILDASHSLGIIADLRTRDLMERKDHALTSPLPDERTKASALEQEIEGSTDLTQTAYTAAIDAAEIALKRSLPDATNEVLVQTQLKAVTALGCHLDMRGITTRDPALRAQAVNLLEAAAKAGWGEAQMNMAYLHAEEDSATKNLLPERIRNLPKAYRLAIATTWMMEASNNDYLSPERRKEAQSFVNASPLGRPVTRQNALLTRDPR